MGRINWGKVFLGGLLAGVVINVGEFLFHAVIFKEDMAEAMRALGRDPATVMTGNAIVIWNILGFLTGIAAVWVYAAIRPRFGPGARTAAIAGIAVWFISRFLGAIAEMNMGMYSQKLIMIGLVWGLVEFILAAVAGAWAYKEA
ncbi:MAG TPA: hypothetical protein VGS98_04670 [Thermoanaerobaculia bacterium]|jgi:hypothetical protein|nr:hypothetical protein [Thermoanaerobaculia bacterium]